MSALAATVSADTAVQHAVMDTARRDVDRLERAFDRCGDGLYRFFVVRIGGDRHTADDLMQQLWTQTLHHAPAASDEHVEYWLRGVARNLIRTHWRRQAARPINTPLVDPTLAADLAERLIHEELPAAALEKKELRDQLLLALTELPAEGQELIIGHYFDHLPQATIAQRLNVSPRAIEGRLYRARHALREKLQHLE